jgi:hypothetical protein
LCLICVFDNSLSNLKYSELISQISFLNILFSLFNCSLVLINSLFLFLSKLFSSIFSILLLVIFKFDLLNSIF